MALTRDGTRLYTPDGRGNYRALWTRDFASRAKDPSGKPLGSSQRHGTVFPLSDAIAGLLAARSFMCDICHLAKAGADNPAVGPELDGYVNTFNDLAATITADVAGEAGRICAEIVHGYNAATAEDAAAFATLRAKLDASLAGTRLAKDRAAKTLSTIMIPEAIDYPL